MASLGQVVRELREERGISASKLERMADLSNPTIWKLEHDEGNPTIATVEKVAGAFGLTAAELMSMAEGDRGRR